MKTIKVPSERRLRQELRKMQDRVAELEATLEAIRSGEIDGIVVEGPQGTHIFSLQSAEEPYRVLAERMNEGAATLSSEGIILFCNQRLSDMVGHPAQQLVGAPLHSILAGPREGYPELVRRALDTGVRTPGSLLRHDGSTLPVQLSLSAVPLEESGRGVCLVATDLTDQQRAQDEVHRLNAELEQRVARRTAELQVANKDLEAFTYAVAHDLRAPLRHINGFCDLLQHDTESSLSTDGRHYLDCIVNGSARLSRLLEDLLKLSRFGKQAVQRQMVDLNALVREVIPEAAQELQDRRIEWKVADLPRTDCDPALLKIVFVNLLSNAIKFTRRRANTTIEIGQKTLDGETVLFVRDNGAGFDMKYAAKLFGLFQRLHKEEDFEGTGVGLATVQRILQKHRGRIWVEAEPDKGATFYFTCGEAETGAEPQRALGATV